MPFRNPIIGGTALIRPAIRSPNYVPGSAGWSVNRDGTAEFGSATIRGTIQAATIDGSTINGGTITGASINGGQLLISDPDGSYIQIFDEDPGFGAVVDIKPANQLGHTFTPARVQAESTPLPLAYVWFLSPKINGNNSSYLFLRGRNSNDSEAALHARRISIVANSGSPGGGVTGGSVDLSALNESTRSSTITRNGGQSFLPNEKGITVLAVSSGTDTVTSGSFVNMAGTGSVTSFAFTKQYNDTRLCLEMQLSYYVSDSNTSAEFALLINGVDYNLFGLKPTMPALLRLHYSAFIYVPAGVPAGAYTVQARWRRTTGTGTPTRDTTDLLAIRAREIAP